MATRTVIMAKNDMLALITMVKSERGASITTLDPRRGHPLVKIMNRGRSSKSFAKCYV